MEESQIDDIPHVSIQENEILIQCFSKTKVRDAIFQMNHNSAPGQDGFQLVSVPFIWWFGELIGDYKPSPTNGCRKNLLTSEGNSMTRAIY